MMHVTITLPFDRLRRGKLEFLRKLIHRDRTMVSYMVTMLRSQKAVTKYGMDALFLSTKSRKRVRYNLKRQFTFRTREYQEIRDWAWEIHRSSVVTGTSFKRGKAQTTRRLTLQHRKENRLSTGTARIEPDALHPRKFWLMIYDPWGKNRWLPFFLPKGQSKRLEGWNLRIFEAKTAHISLKGSRPRLHLTFKIDAPSDNGRGQGRELILGLDPGLRVPYTGVFVDADQFELKGKLIRYYRVPAHSRKLHQLDLRLSQLRQKLETLKKVTPAHHWNRRKRKLVKSLNRTHRAWLGVRRQAEHELSQQILADCENWRQAGWQVKIAVGYPKGIRDAIPALGRKQRRRQYRWRYFGRWQILERVAKASGIPVIPINERYTSRTCWRCGTCEFRRYRSQSLQRRYGRVLRHGGWFECLRCGFKGNADVNGAINMVRKYLIMRDRPKGLVSLGRRLRWWQGEWKRRTGVKDPKDRWGHIRRQHPVPAWVHWPSSKKWIQTMQVPKVPDCASIYDRTVLRPPPSLYL